MTHNHTRTLQKRPNYRQNKYQTWTWVQYFKWSFLWVLAYFKITSELSLEPLTSFKLHEKARKQMRLWKEGNLLPQSSYSMWEKFHVSKIWRRWIHFTVETCTYIHYLQSLLTNILWESCIEHSLRQCQCISGNAFSGIWPSLNLWFSGAFHSRNAEIVQICTYTRYFQWYFT